MSTQPIPFPAPTLATATAVSTRLRALVLDDDDIDHLRLQRICERAGLDLDITEAYTIAEMREKLDTPFDVAFIDYNLGMETGLDALKVLLGHEEQTQVIPIMLTSVTRRAIAVEAMRRGCADYLVKEELSVDNLRKSMVSAFERRMFYASIADARAFQARMRHMIQQFLTSCGPEMREILSNTLAHIRKVRAAEGGTSGDAHVTLLERGCKDLVVFLDDLMSIVEQSKLETARNIKLVNSTH
ncbi:response regulator [Vannielia litorea]|uniref:Response regulator receiver domain-containing protein n=1 Tax=Vannielia litorea TaxID=1217970 RepID=A0A1N6HEK3_9RHOB|nr:response regulator [Vannielia litorea]SIO18119.1 Response regulator receiver domain-containing protein [Vannielia litorea]